MSTPLAFAAHPVSGAALPGRTAHERRWSPADVVALSVVVVAAYALKRHYSTASAEDLRWALAPTTHMVALFTGAHFTMERGAGFVIESRRLVIAPACAGVNFLVISLLSLTFTFVTKVRRPSRKAMFVLASATVAYASMVLVNATRISLVLFLSPHLRFLGGGSAAQLHRVEGVVTYLAALWLLTTLGRFLLKAVNR